MHIVGRKSYHAWSDTLTLGFTLLTNEWSEFTSESDQHVAELFDLFRVVGEIIPQPIGPPLQNPYGRDVDGHVKNRDIWHPRNKVDAVLMPGFCGRRLLTTWSDNTMLVIDKIVGDQERFGVVNRPGQNCMLYDVFETMGTLVEFQIGRPAGDAYGKSANQIVSNAEIAGPPIWMTQAEYENLPTRYVRQR